MSAGIASDVSTIVDLTLAVCLSPCLDRPSDPAAETEARELLLVAQEIKEKLDIALSDDVRADVVQFITYLEQNRERYRQSAMRWIDLLEDIAFYAETMWGSQAGVKKQREVRAAIYHVLKGFFGSEGMTTVQPWLRPIVIEIAVRATVEFLVTLDNPHDENADRKLWDMPAEGMVILKGPRVRMAKYTQTLMERFVGGMVRLVMPPPRMSGPLRRDVDRILADWAKRNDETQSEPVERVVGVIGRTMYWVGQHGDQVRAAIDVISLTIYEAAELTRLDREQRIEVIKNAVILMFQDLGYRGPIFGTVVRFLVDLSADAIQHLFEKKELRRQARS